MNSKLGLAVGSNWATKPNHILADIEEEFDEVADLYETLSADWDYRGAADGSAFFIANVAKPARVLEAGCGSGLVGQQLNLGGFSGLTGCDISSGMLGLAEAKGVYSGGLFKSDICAMPFAENSFDALVCIAVLTYAASIEKVFAEFDRVVRSNGYIVFSHRVDLESACGFRDALDGRLRKGNWTTVSVSTPQLYYPRKSDYLNKITVRYHAYRT